LPCPGQTIIDNTEIFLEKQITLRIAVRPAKVMPNIESIGLDFLKRQFLDRDRAIVPQTGDDVPVLQKIVEFRFPDIRIHPQIPKEGQAQISAGFFIVVYWKFIGSIY
jgi:hypothetical protein